MSLSPNNLFCISCTCKVSSLLLFIILFCIIFTGSFDLFYRRIKLKCRFESTGRTRTCILRFSFCFINRFLMHQLIIISAFCKSDSLRIIIKSALLPIPQRQLHPPASAISIILPLFAFFVQNASNFLFICNYLKNVK